MKFKGVLSITIAVASGVLVLGGYFIQLPVLETLRTILLQWAIVLTGFAVLLGIFQLMLVHSSRIRTGQKGSVYSILLVIAMLATFLGGLILGPQDPLVGSIFRSVQLPVEASLMALLAVTLTYASIRLLRRSFNLFSLIFLVTAVLVLLGTAPLPYVGNIPLLSDLLRPWITQVVAAGGARGILLGVALGTLTTGLRIFLGVDRPYGGG